jgi:hypothetical protein
MPRAAGLMNPDNAAKSAGPFKEGYIRIESNTYKVQQSKGEDAVPATKWAWSVTRLAENGEEPLTDEHDEPIREELYFSFGGKSLPFVHPGKADSPDDEEPEDLGTAVDAEGNTIYLNAPDWRPNEKSGLMMLTRSLAAQGIKPEFLNRCWTPDWNGCVFFMRSQQGEKGRDGREFSYKVVSKVLVGPGGKKGSSSKANGAVASNGAEPETYLAPILHKLSVELDGQTLTRKAFVNRVRAALDEAKTDSKLLVPVLSLCKDEKWLTGHAETFDYSVNSTDNTIAFGQSA